MTQAARIRALVPAYLAAIAGIPLLVVVSGVNMAVRQGWHPVALLLAVPTYVLLYVMIAGLLSRLTRSAIVPGTFPRDLGHPIYGPRRLYALCWTAIFYCTPLYHAVLAIGWFRTLTFRLFGYSGSLDFQTYPDTWLRDVPLLQIGKGAYLSNKATVSPNMCQRDGSIIVLPIIIGARTMVGHLTMIAPGVSLGADVEIGVGASIGVKATIGSGSNVGHCAQIDHQVRIGAMCDIGSRAYVGRRARIADGLRVPPGAVVPPKAILRTQSDVDALRTGAVVVLTPTKARLSTDMPTATSLASL